MALAPGARLGPYEITALIGAGGMGEVWCATDSNLGRRVAIKVLPDVFADEPERLARFEREAKTLASLNHPNIGGIYGLEKADVSSRSGPEAIRALVMELVEGPTLADRIARGPIPIDEALPIARQIAAALESAHEQGIIHRDLKPANIKVRQDGTVKVLDFGLAKVIGPSAVMSSGRSVSPTITTPAMTQLGMILGTAAYMSPEQARGKPLDKRADLWALGCVLYEMLTGKPAFVGETVPDVLAAVINNEPDWTALPADTPQTIRALLTKCSRKDPTRRLHDAADARIDIEEAIAHPIARPPATAASRRASVGTVVGWLTATVLAIALFIVRFGASDATSSLPRVVRLELNMPPGVEASEVSTPNMAISPDGTRVAFIGGIGGLRRIFIRRFDEFESTAIKGTETANICAFSPDGSTMAFVAADRTLKKVSLSDGLVTTLVGDVEWSGGGVAWSQDGTITFIRAGALWRTPATGGKTEQLTTLNAATDERAHLWPAAVTDSGVLFTSVSGTDRVVTRVESLSFVTKERRVVVDNGSNPLYAASGHLLFFRDGALLAAPFDAAQLQVTGPAVSVLKEFSLDQFGAPLVNISSAGALSYLASGQATKRLVWVSRQGVEQPITDARRPYKNPRLAPDGRRIVVEVAGGDLWIQDVDRATFTRLTTGDTMGNTFAVWTPDGHGVLFRNLTGIRRVDPDNGGAKDLIRDTSLSSIPTSVSPDGRTLAYIQQTPETNGDLYTLSLQGNPQPRAVVKTSGYDGGGQFSPNGQWLAYASNESGQFDVYVRPYPGPDRRVPVSTEGGTHPRWSRNGKELFYRNGNKMMVVDVSTSSGITLSRPRVLFEQRYAFGAAQTVPNFDISPDGQRFVMVKDDSASGRINVVLNWFEELKRMVPLAP
jgi:serine/threonine protein kinase/Tol biopolymer transport system component